MIYEVSVAGDVALNRLETEGAFTVHSVFNNGMNLLQNNQLVFIGTNKNGYFPFGLTLNQKSMHEILSVVKVGDMLTKYHQEIRHRNFSLMLNRAEILRSQKDFYKADISELLSNMKYIDFSEYNNSDFNTNNMAQLISALKNNDESLEDNLRFFIGRGQGLTPSGDDIITGILYANRLKPFIKQESFDKIKQLYQLNLTTMVSQSFVLLALDGIFSSKITDLQHDASLERIQSLVKLGSSSGLDTLYGIFKTLKQE